MIPVSPEFWEHLFEGVTPGGKIILVALLVISVLGGKYLQIIRTNQKTNREVLERTEEQAKLAADRSLPTSNGFAAGVTKKLDLLMDGLNRIADRQERIEKRTERMEERQQEMEKRLSPPKSRSSD